MGCDVALVALLIFCPDFNPRTPCGVRRRDPYPENRGGGISIHAPLAGRDSGDPTHRSAPPYFNPRTPCGVRRGYQDQITAALVFQSTHPLRGATTGSFLIPRRSRFQSTRPMRGATIMSARAGLPSLNFNPRAPCGARRPGGRGRTGKPCISIHAPLAGCDTSKTILQPG